MNKIWMFVLGIVALIILIVNIGPMIVLGVSIYLLYIILKQFGKAESTTGKIGWIIAGLIVLSIGLSNIFAVIGVAALYLLYVLYKHWQEEKEVKTV
ncbi:permease [Evansella cellulosilytica]|uniref:Flagellar basal body rod protein n=1 Tax=Evansella cellulosilytica (strain ATCC 21833 / DSM 2522 / FERM P-1141 / JCM 9156 / N-4) TaxID=649639 RepID=E6TZQ1_EVAC2|nr:permease [Evansella cellulosilytica]ADU31357.1 hypothetical protein Bcell_3114 [Evansella cellulosilytica DSM 2522]